MTKIITRYFDSAARGRDVRQDLIFIYSLSPKIIDVYEGATGLSKALTTAGVAKATATAYQKRMKEGGGAVLLVRAGYKPLGVAVTARQVAAEGGAADLGDLVEEAVVPDRDTRHLSIMPDHPFMMSKDPNPEYTNVHMANWPIPLINRRKPFSASIFPRHMRMANFPIGLISRRKPYDGFAFPRHARMANFPIPLLSNRKPKDKFAFPRHARMANFPIPLISNRKPYTGSLIGKHPRMANWPFPHLIDGKTGTNALIPGAPRMANFPIPLLSDRKPKDKFAFPRHARMANFPIPLISRRKPADAFAFPRHARMANLFLPLIARDFSFSKLFGLKTLSPR